MRRESSAPGAPAPPRRRIRCCCARPRTPPRGRTPLLHERELHWQVRQMDLRVGEGPADGAGWIERRSWGVGLRPCEGCGEGQDDEKGRCVHQTWKLVWCSLQYWPPLNRTALFQQNFPSA